MVLKEKLKTIKIGNDSGAGYLTKITNVRDELAAVGEVISPTELVQIAVNGLPRSWMNFADGVYAHETLPTSERFWDDCIQTKIRKGSHATQVQREHAFPSISGASSGIWYVDSGASHHMTGVREYFSELSECGTDMEVVLGDDRVVRAVGVETLTFQRESKPPLKVSDVLYVLGMRKNLIFVLAFEDKRYEVLFRGGQVLMYPRGTPADSTRVIGVRHAKVYKFAFQSLLALSSSPDSRASSSELYEIWHCKMGHMYHGALRTLREITTSRKIKSLRSDNGGEYTLGEFVDYCVEAGIRRKFTVPYNPQQNGVAERKNRSIGGAAKAMLHDQGLPLFLWAEACSIAVYLQNRSPHCALGHRTPEEDFSRKKLDIYHLHIFGCITYSYIPKEKRTKLDPTAEKGIFVGYHKTSKAFQIYIPA
eukprot:PITA_21603